MNEQVPIDSVKAFRSLQEYHGAEMSRLAGDLAAKNAYISMLQDEILALKAVIERQKSVEPSSNGSGEVAAIDVQ